MQVNSISSQSFQGKYLSVARNISDFPQAKKAVSSVSEQIIELAKEHGVKVHMKRKPGEIEGYRLCRHYTEEVIPVKMGDPRDPGDQWFEFIPEVLEYKLPVHSNLLDIVVRHKSWNPLKIFSSKYRDRISLKKDQISNDSILDSVKTMITKIKGNTNKSEPK